MDTIPEPQPEPEQLKEKRESLEGQLRENATETDELIRQQEVLEQNASAWTEETHVEAYVESEVGKYLDKRIAEELAFVCDSMPPLEPTGCRWVCICPQGGDCDYVLTCGN